MLALKALPACQGIVMASDKSPRGIERLNLLIEKASIDIVPTSESDAVAGIAAHMRYGKGSGHKAKLNFGDCFAYALAKSRNLPLLFKGDDFIHTDIEPAQKPA
ncbi:type II toxin-antitoxin system VapC family toxin [Mesorhizobium sp. CAU 1732]|uniref:type II toxin-antitoxin system VapC family toxin n=1 Tax=Mesorhizobium sp. CAU 1732 TaxID=3140358 RepID=UPI0032618916